MFVLKSVKFALVSTAVLTLAACAPSNSDSSNDVKEKAPLTVANIHDQALVLDSHVDLELPLIAEDMDPWSSGETRANLDKMEAGGMDGAFLILFSPQGELTKDGVATARNIVETRFKAIRRLTEKHGDRIELALNAADAKRIHKAGKRIALIGIGKRLPAR